MPQIQARRKDDDPESSVRLSYGKAVLQFFGADSIHMMIVIVLLMCTGSILWVDYDTHTRQMEINRENSKLYLAAHKLTQDNQHAIIKLMQDGQAEVKKSNATLVWVLAQKQEVRDLLPLTTPDEFRRRFRDDK